VLRWLLAGIGTIAALGAMAALGYALLVRPELLRSERHSLLTRFFDVIGDSEMDATARERISLAILGATEGRGTKHQSAADSRRPRPGEQR
jgi:hypothetical protein